MDYKTLYTPTEASAMYNIAKIKYDPTSYSLKGNLITNCDSDELLKQHIGSYSYDAEKHLSDVIHFREPKRCKIVELTGMSGNTAFEGANNEMSALCVQQDNLYINLDILSRYFPLNKLKASNIMQTLITMCIALNSDKSCAKDMLHMAFTQTHKAPYETVHTFAYLKDSLKMADGELLLLLSNCTVESRYVPTRDEEIDYTSIPFKQNQHLGIDTLYSHVINSFEVLWAWKHLQESYKDCFAQLCISADVKDKFDLGLYSKYFTPAPIGFDIHPEIDAMTDIANPEERYTAYQKFLETEGASILTTCKNYYNIEFDKGHYLNPIFAAFTSFVMQISLANIRINTIRILHDYCVTHKYITNEETKDVNEMSKGFLGKFGASLTTPKKESSKDLVDFSEPKTYGGVAEGDADEDAHDTTAMYEALDKVKASFSSGKYKFTVTDIKDTADESRDAYNAIASKVELVNKLLIRKIKDIKTYNVGGKCSGASSGRIDRKAVYRYKYDPNIFYNNTYKTLESDLAFGIILDESGSMSGRGIKDGRTTMIVLHETLKALGINHCMIGHTSDGKHHSDIYRYQAFKEDKTYKTCKNYALVKTEAKAGNCDSGALYYIEKAFDRVRNKDKICLIFSDGAPTECTGKELKDQVRHMEKKGIKVIGIGINFSSISKYYTDYANGRNLTDMLNIVAKILEEYVLKKKDK